MSSHVAYSRTVNVRLTPADRARLEREAERLRHKAKAAGCVVATVTMSDLVRNMVRAALDASEADARPGRDARGSAPRPPPRRRTRTAAAT